MSEVTVAAHFQGVSKMIFSRFVFPLLACSPPLEGILALFLLICDH